MSTEIQAENRRRLIAYFEDGAQAEAGPVTHADGTLDRPGALGVEVEHVIVHGPAKEPVTYEPAGDALGVRQVLAYLERFYPEAMRNEDGDLVGLAGDIGSVTIEPAAQLEISLAPYQRVADVAKSYNLFRSQVDPFLAEHGAHIESVGYNPGSCAADLPLIPKDRYRFMDRYFHMIGTHGERMMRASASTQVSVDYTSEADAVRKMRVGTALGPILAFICDNTPVFEGEPTTAPLARFNLWRDVDNARCGALPGLFDEGYGFAAYADYLLRTPPIFVTRPAADDPEGPAERWTGSVPAAEAYGDAPMSQADIEHLISMFWPDVRLKHFVEIRPADCMPAPQVFGYTALIKGLFYSDASLSAVEDAVGVKDGVWPLGDGSVNEVLAAVRSGAGADATAYGHSIRWWVGFLFDLASAALDAEERAYLPALQQFARL